MIREKLFEKKPCDVKIPSMVKAELLFGVKKSRKCSENLQKVQSFLSPFQVISFGEREAGIYGKIRWQLEKQGNPIGANDLIIASIVIANSGILVTNNEKEFSQVHGLKIQNWTL